MIKHTGIALGLLLAGCVSDGKDGAEGAMGAEGTAGTNGANGVDGMQGMQGPAGPQLAMPALYSLTNAGGNQVAAYLRSSNGNLSRMGKFATGGNGGAPASQGSLVFDAATQRFFAVNNGNDTISMLSLGADGKLQEITTVSSGGKKPVSIAVHGNTVYVANRGDAGNSIAGNITGFKIMTDSLEPITGSTHALSAASDVRPTDIGFSPDGKFLVVAELLTNKLDTYALTGGVAADGSFQTSAGLKPFAFDFSPEGYLMVAEVGDGSSTGSSASSYAISNTGVLTPVTSALATGQGAACWLVAAGDYAYVANAASGTITGLNVSQTGVLTLHDGNGVTGTTSSGSVDLAVSPDRGFLYALANDTSGKQVFVFEMRPNGNLASVGALAGLASTTSGLVAR